MVYRFLVSVGGTCNIKEGNMLGKGRKERQGTEVRRSRIRSLVIKLQKLRICYLITSFTCEITVSLACETEEAYEENKFTE